MDRKKAMLAVSLLAMGVFASTDCIVSGTLQRPPTHQADSAGTATIDVRGGGMDSAAGSPSAVDPFEARSWTAAEAETDTLNCLPPIMLIILR